VELSRQDLPLAGGSLEGAILCPGLCMGFLLKLPDIQVERSPRTRVCVDGAAFCPAPLQASQSRRIYGTHLCLLFPPGSLGRAPSQHADHFCHLLGHQPLSMRPAKSGGARSQPWGATWAPATKSQVCGSLMGLSEAFRGFFSFSSPRSRLCFFHRHRIHSVTVFVVVVILVQV